MASSFAALAPIFLVIGLGVWIRHWLKADDGFWRLLEKLTYFILFPALLIHRLGTTELPESGLLAAMAALLLPSLVVTIIGLALRRPLNMNGADFATGTMGAIRFNTYAGLAGAVALYGQEGLAVFALLLAGYIPLVNIISALLLGRFAQASAASPRALLRAVVTNPLVVACAIGIVINLSHVPVPAFAERTLAILGNAALGAGLVSVGAALRIDSLLADRRGIAIATAIKLLALPALAAGFCHLFGVGDLERGVVVLFAALPSSPAAYVLARQMGGNAPMMAGIITVSTPAAMIAIPLVLALFG
jgi:malonate transporter and related proteins